jgi:hypothetical protein
VGARGRRPLWSFPWVPVTFGHCEILFFLIFYSSFGPCPTRPALPCLATLPPALAPPIENVARRHRYPIISEVFPTYLLLSFGKVTHWGNDKRWGIFYFYYLLITAVW